MSLASQRPVNQHQKAGKAGSAGKHNEKAGKAIQHIRKTRNPLLIESGQSEASQPIPKSRKNRKCRKTQ